MAKFFSLTRLNKNYFQAMVASYSLMAVMILVQLVLVPLYLKYLGKEQFGVLTIILAANSYAAIGIGWLSGGMVRILSEYAALNDVKGFRSGYAFSKLLYVGYAIVSVCIFWCVGPWVLKHAFHEKDIVEALIFSSLYLILVYEYNADRAAFTARHWQAKGNQYEIVGQVLFAVCVLIGLKNGWGLVSVTASQVVGILATRLLAWRYWRCDEYRLSWRFFIPEFKALLKRVSGKMGRHYIIYGAIVLSLQADVLLLGWLSGSGVVAEYYLLWRMPEVIIMLFWRIPGTYSPFLIAMDARGEHGQLERNYQRGLYVIIVLAAVAALIYAIGGPFIVSVWVGSNAPTDHLPYLFAACAMFFTSIARWPSGVAYSLLNTANLIKISGIELLLKVILVTLLHTRVGFFTPMLVTTVIHALGLFFLYLWLGKKTVRKG